MSIIGALIATACIDMQGNYGPACKSALEAGTKQVGLEQAVSKVEGDAGRWADKEADKLIDKDIKGTVGGVLFLAKIYKDRKIAVPLPTADLVSSANTVIDDAGRSASLVVVWNF